MANAPSPRRARSKTSKDLSTQSIAGDRLFQAARNVVLRYGVIKLDHPAIAAEANRKVGTVGRFLIEDYRKHIAAYPFACLIATIAPEGHPGCRDPQTAYAAIDRLIEEEPEIAKLAIASLSLGTPTNPDDALRQHFMTCREKSIAVLRDHAVSEIGLKRTEAEAFAVAAVERFFERSVGQILRSQRERAKASQAE